MHLEGEVLQMAEILLFSRCLHRQVPPAGRRFSDLSVPYIHKVGKQPGKPDISTLSGLW